MLIRVFGSFVILNATGEIVLPKGSKTRALAALLATSPNLSRPRAWIQDMLWSDRGPDQKAASLRQSLAELRRTWAVFPEALQADRQRIWLDADRVAIESDQTGIFLEDISVRDPAFNAWLGLQRLQLAQPHASPQPGPAQITGSKALDRMRVAICIDSGWGPDQVELTSALHDMLVLMFRETGTISVVQPKALERQLPDRLLNLTSLGQRDGLTQIRAVLETPSEARVVWTGQIGIATDRCAPRNNAALMSFCNQILEMTCQASRFVDLAGARSPEPTEQDLSNRVGVAVSSIFSIRSDRIQKAVLVLENLVAERPHPVLYAWLAQAYTIQYVERYKPADSELRERCEQACRAALAGGAQNSNVLAAVANARTNINRNYLAGIQLAEQSIKANSANPLAWWSYSNALQCVGRTELAHRAAKNAQLLADCTSLQFWCDFQVSVTAALLGETAAAIENGERAVALVPDFRPPLRYLTALYAMEGDAAAMGRTASALKSVELDFTVLQMIEDEDYPIGMMRRYGKNLTRALRNVASESDVD